MSKILIAITVLVLAIVGFRWWQASHAQSAPIGNPVTDMMSEDLKAKFQADLSIRIPNLDNLMKQSMALGNSDPEATKGLLNDVTTVHTDMDNCQQHLLKLGDSQATVSAWLTRIQWDEFQQTEAQFRKFAAN
jgi:hypothetical protein